MEVKMNEVGLYRISVHSGIEDLMIEGIFKSSKKYVDYLIKDFIEVWCDEYFGKTNGDIVISIRPDNVELITCNPIVFDNNFEIGFNPFNYDVHRLYDGDGNEYDDYEGTNVGEFIRYLIDEEIEDIYTI